MNSLFTVVVLGFLLMVYRHRHLSHPRTAGERGHLHGLQRADEHHVDASAIARPGHHRRAAQWVRALPASCSSSCSRNPRHQTPRRRTSRMTGNDSRPSLWERFVELGNRRRERAGRARLNRAWTRPRRRRRAAKSTPARKSAPTTIEPPWWRRSGPTIRAFTNAWLCARASSSSTGCTASRRCWLCASSSSS